MAHITIPFISKTLPIIYFGIGLGFLGWIADHFAPPTGLLAPASTAPASSAGSATDAFPRVLIDGSGMKVKIARPARRVVSGDWAIDEFLYSVVPPERVVGASGNAFVERVSNVFPWTQQFHPAVANDPERVIRTNPDLVLVSSATPADFTNLINAAGIPTYRMDTNFAKLADIEDAIRLTGYLTGEDASAGREAAKFREAIAAALAMRPKDRKPPRILGFSANFTYGSGTVFDDIVRSIGGVNVGAEGGLKGYDTVSGERIVRWNPEWIVTGADQGKTKEALARMLADPSIAATEAARKGHILVLEFHIFLPLSPYTRLLVTEMAKGIYGGS